MAIGERSVPQDDAAIVLGKRLNEIPAEVDRMRRFPLGRSRGLEFGLIMHHLGGTEVYVEGEANRKTALAKDNPGARAVLNAVERLMWKAGDEIEGYKADIRLKEGQLRDYDARAGTPFAHQGYSSQLADLRDELKLGLSDGASEEAKGKFGELAERIRELRDGNAVEGAPERTGARRTVRAERSVTACIRERLGEVVAEEPEQVVETLASPTAEVIVLPVPVVEEAASPADGFSLISEVERPSGHGQRVVRRRASQGQMRLF